MVKLSGVNSSYFTRFQISSLIKSIIPVPADNQADLNENLISNGQNEVQKKFISTLRMLVSNIGIDQLLEGLELSILLQLISACHTYIVCAVDGINSQSPKSWFSFCCDLVLLLLNKLADFGIAEHLEVVICLAHKSFRTLISYESTGMFRCFLHRLLCKLCSKFLKLLRHQFIVDESNRKYQRSAIELLLPCICTYLSCNCVSTASNCVIHEIRLLLCYGLFTSNTLSEFVGINVTNKSDIIDLKSPHNIRKVNNAETVIDLIVTFCLDQSVGPDKTSAVMCFLIHGLIFSFITLENDQKGSGSYLKNQLPSVLSKLQLTRIVPFICSITFKLRQHSNIIFQKYLAIIDSILFAVFDCFRGNQLHNYNLSSDCTCELFDLVNYVIRECDKLTSAIKSNVAIDEAFLTNFSDTQQMINLRDSLLFTVGNICKEDTLKDPDVVVAKYLSLDELSCGLQWKCIDFLEKKWNVNLVKILEVAITSNGLVSISKKVMTDSINKESSKQGSNSLIIAFFEYIVGKFSMFIKIWKFMSELRAINELIIAMNSVWSHSSSLMHPVVSFILSNSHVESYIVSGLLSIPFGQIQSLENSFISSIALVDFSNWGKLWLPTISCKLNKNFEKTSLQIKSDSNELNRQSQIVEKLSVTLLSATKELHSLLNTLNSNIYQSYVLSLVRRIIAFLSSAIYLLADMFQESRPESKKIICTNITESSIILFQQNVLLLSSEMRYLLLEVKLLFLQFCVDIEYHIELMNLHADNMVQSVVSDFVNSLHCAEQLSNLKSFSTISDKSILFLVRNQSIVENNIKFCFFDVLKLLLNKTNSSLCSLMHRSSVVFGTKLWTVNTVHVLNGTINSIQDFHQSLFDSSSNAPYDAVYFYALLCQLFSIHLLKQLGLSFILKVLESTKVFIISSCEENVLSFVESAVKLANVAVLHELDGGQCIVERRSLTGICKCILHIRRLLHERRSIDGKGKRIKTYCIQHLGILLASILTITIGSKNRESTPTTFDLIDLLFSDDLSVEEVTDAIMILHMRVRYTKENIFENDMNVLTDVFQKLSHSQGVDCVVSTVCFLKVLAELNGRSWLSRNIEHFVSNKSLHSTSAFLILFASECAESYHRYCSMSKIQFLIQYKIFTLLVKVSLLDVYESSRTLVAQNFINTNLCVMNELNIVGNLSFSFVLLKNYMLGAACYQNFQQDYSNYIPVTKLKLALDEIILAFKTKSSEAQVHLQYALEFGSKLLEFSILSSGVFDFDRYITCLDNLEKFCPLQSCNDVDHIFKNSLPASVVKYSSFLNLVALNQVELNLDECHGTLVLPFLKRLCKKVESFISQVKRMHIVSKKLPILLKIFLRIHGIVLNIHDVGILGESECKQCFQYLGRMLSLFSLVHFKKCSQYMIIGVMKDTCIRKSNLLNYFQEIVTMNNGNRPNAIRYSVYNVLEKLQSHEKEFMLKMLDSVERLIMTDLNEEMHRNFKFDGN